MTLPLFNIGGLASGLDTNAIIDQLMEAERIPLQQLEIRRAGYEAKDQAWQDVATRFAALRTTVDTLDASSDFGTFMTATSSDETAVGVTVTGSATPGVTSFSVDALATNHQLASATSFASGDALVGAGDLTITVGGTGHVVTTTASTTLTDLAQQINSLGIDVSAQVVAIDASNVKLVLSATETGAAGAFTSSGTQAGLATFDVVQQAQDAQLTLGSGPGALTLTRSSNTVTDLIAGATIELKTVTTGTVDVTVGRDVDAAVEAVKAFVDELNLTLTTIDDMSRYNVEAETGGPLVGDGTARDLLSDLRLAVSGTVNEGSTYPFAGSVGISISRDGTFTFDETTLRAALAADFEAVVDVFSTSATTVDVRLSFVSATSATVDGSYDVVVTQAAARPEVTGTKYKSPTSQTTFQIVIDGDTVNVTVAQDATIQESLDAIDDALTAAGVSTLTASQVVLPDTNDAIHLQDSRYGSSVSFQVIGDPFGLAGTHTGVDVAGTIGGQTATGAGQLLTGTASDPTGLTVQVTATQAEVDGAGGSLDLGAVTISNGFMGAVADVLDIAEGADGRVARARNRWQAQIDLMDDRIERFEDRLDVKELALLKRFAALETTMANLLSQANFLSAQLPSLGSGTGT